MIDLTQLRRAEFPWAERGDSIYLNHASTGPLPERAVRALAEFNALRAEPWRISQEYQFGVATRARELCAQLINAHASEIALMVNTSYGLNFAARALPFAAGDVILSSDREFPSNVYPWMALARDRGVNFEQLPCAGRLLDEEALITALDRPGVRGVVISWVSFETGLRADLARIGAACRARGIYFIVDAIQGLGAAPLDVRECHIDILACGAQKWLLAPWGTGFVYVRDALVRELEPNVVSWMAVRDSDDFTRMLEYDFTYRDDARRFEMITLPFQDFAGLNASLELFFEVGIGDVMRRIEAHASYIVEWAQEQSDVTLLTPASTSRRAGVVALIPRDPLGASARLTAARVAHSLREGAIRLSPHFYTTREEIDGALETIGRA